MLNRLVLYAKVRHKGVLCSSGTAVLIYIYYTFICAYYISTYHTWGSLYIQNDIRILYYTNNGKNIVISKTFLTRCFNHLVSCIIIISIRYNIHNNMIVLDINKKTIIRPVGSYRNTENITTRI